MTVTVKQVGGSVAVVIPKAVASELELAAGTSLDVTTSGGSIVMRKRSVRGRARRPIAKIVAGIKPGSYRRRRKELGEDGPVGKELW